MFIAYCRKKNNSSNVRIETITILAIASTTGHAISEQGLFKTILALCTLVGLLLIIQFLTIKYNFIKRFFIGKETPVIQDGKVLMNNLKKLRILVDQLEARVRELGISAITDIKTASFEITGQFGYELMDHAKTVTIGDLERSLGELQLTILQQLEVIEKLNTKDLQKNN